MCRFEISSPLRDRVRLVLGYVLNFLKVALIQSSPVLLCSPLGPEGKVCSLPFFILTSSTVKCNVAPPGMDPKNICL